MKGLSMIGSSWDKIFMVHSNYVEDIQYFQSKLSMTCVSTHFRRQPFCNFISILFKIFMSSSQNKHGYRQATIAGIVYIWMIGEREKWSTKGCSAKCIQVHIYNHDWLYSISMQKNLDTSVFSGSNEGKHLR